MNYWAIALVSVYALRVSLGFVSLGKGSKEMKAQKFQEHGSALLFRTIFDGVLFAGALGAFS